MSEGRYNMKTGKGCIFVGSVTRERSQKLASGGGGGEMMRNCGVPQKN